MQRDRRSLIGLLLLVLLVSGGSQWWAARQQRQLGAQLARSVAPGDLRMLSSRTCPICTQARRYFQEHGVPFEECFIETDTACAQRFEALQAPGTPVLVVRGVPQLGFDPRRLLRSLEPS